MHAASVSVAEIKAGELPNMQTGAQKNLHQGFLYACFT